MTVSVDGRPVEGLEGTKSGALLAYLAVEKAVAVPRARIAADFWPELSDRAGRNNLRQALYQLRQRLATACDGAHDWIELSRDAVRFSSEEPHWVDVEVLTRDPPCCGHGRHTAACRPALEGMQAVLDTYGGPFLQGFDSGDLPPSVAEWLTRCRRYYRDAVVAVLERFTACLTRAGAIQRALDYTRRFITIEPDAEAAHRILLRLLHHNEAVDEAIRHYDALAERLFEEQGRTPEAETVALGERLLTRREQMRRLALADEGSGLERRLVSVVAVTFRPDATHGPEERARVYSDVSRQVGAIVEEFGGLPGRSHGGRLIIYFGLPEAGDTTTMQAVRAAFRIVRTVQAGGTLQVAVDSDWLLTTGSPALPDPAGDLSEAVSRLAERTPANACVITAAVHTRVYPCFDSRPLEDPAGQHALYQVTADRQLEDRIAISRQLGGVSPFIGRRAQLEHLRREWRRVPRHGLQRVIVEGEAGVGKTRLVEEWLNEVYAGGGIVFHLRCSPEHRRQPLYPVIDALRRHLERRLTPGDGTDWDAAMEAFLAECGDLPDDAARGLRRLLDTDPSACREGMTEALADAVEQRDRLLDLLMEVTAAFTARAPLLVVVEDLHWIDPTTVMLLRRAIEGLAERPLLFLVSGRPGTVYPWRSEDPVVRLHLQRLNESESAELLDAIAGGEMPAEMRRQILYYADGIPLFIEELARQHRQDAMAVTVPATLRDLLSARLQGLGSTRGLAQLAATLGREFDGEMLAAIATLDGDEIEAGLEHLMAAGFVERSARGLGGTHWYRFRHALIREAVYDSQLDSERAERHLRIAEVIQERYPEIAWQRPGYLAHHLTRGEQPVAALPYRIRAGYQTLARAAHDEASRHFRDALSVAEELGDEETRRARMVECLLGLGLADMASRGYGDGRVYATFKRARALHAWQADPGRHFLLLWGEWHGASSHAGFAEAQRIADRMLELADSEDDRVRRLAAYYAQINCRFSWGDLHGARQYFETLTGLYDDGDHGALVGAFGDDPALAGESFGALTLWCLGETGRAREVTDAAVAKADAEGHPPSQVFCYTFQALIAQYGGDVETTAEVAKRLLRVAEERDYALWRRAGQALLGWARARSGDRDGLRLLQQAVSDIRHVMYGVSTILLRLQIDALIGLGRLAPARSVLAQAMADVARIGNKRFLPELYRRRGEIDYLMQRDREAADVDLRHAEALAAEQDAVMELIRIQSVRLDYGITATADGREERERLARLLDGLPAQHTVPHVERARRLLAAG